MSMPAQVRKQSEHVAELQQQLAGNPPTDAVDPAAPVTVDSNQSAAPPVQPVTQPVSDTFEQKYKTLQGMYNKEVPALRAEVQNLTNLLATLQQAPVRAPAAPAPATPNAPNSRAKAVSDSDVEQYGDAIEVMKRAARDEAQELFQGEIDALRATINKLTNKFDKELVPAVNSVVTTQAQYSDQEFWRDLSGVVPNWREINENEDFHTWLLELDQLSGFSRQTSLEDAHRKLDVNRVAAFFTTWIGQNQAPTPANPGRTASSELNAMVAPGRSKSPAGNNQPADQVITREQVSKFYNDVASGKYRGRDDEKKKMEASIFAATREGRLR